MHVPIGAFYSDFHYGFANSGINYAKKLYIICIMDVTICESPKDYQYGFVTSGICKKAL